MGQLTPISPQDKPLQTVHCIHRPLFQRILFELTLILYLILTNMAIPISQQFLYYIVGKKYSNNGTSNFSPYNTSDKNQVEQETTLLVLYLNMTELFPTVIMVIVLGLYSDVRGNRRLLIWLGILGNVVYGLGFLLTLYISDGNIDHPTTKPLLYIGSLLYGLSGNLPAFTVGISSYISDTDTTERRSLRLSICQFYFCCTYGISNYVTSYWLQYTSDYSVPFLAFTIGSFVIFVLVFVLLKEPDHSDTQQQRLKSTLDGIIGIKDLFRSDTQWRKIMWCTLIAFICYCFVQQGQERTTVLFLKNEPLRWNEEEVGLFFLMQYLVAGVGLLPGVPLLEKCIGEASVVILGLVSFTAGSLVQAFATTPTLIYLSCVVKVFHQIPWASARSLTSKHAGDHEQGSVYAVMHFFQLWMLFLGTASYNAMFFATIQWMNGFVFAISAVFMVPSIVFLFYAKFLIKKNKTENSLPPQGSSLTETDRLVSSSIAVEKFGTVENVEPPLY